MRIVCISDTHELHGKLKNLPEGDLLIHAGDFSGNGNPWRMMAFGQWLRAQSYAHKVVIAGNHDRGLEGEPEWGREIFEGAIYLDRSAHMVAGFKIYGTPWSPAFNDWAFNATPRQQEEYAAAIPDRVDILVTHGPPLGYGDRCDDGREVGCPFLLKRIEEIKPKLVVCGHVHEGYGAYKLPCGTTIVNASVLDEKYRLVNAPIVVEIDDDGIRRVAFGALESDGASV